RSSKRTADRWCWPRRTACGWSSTWRRKLLEEFADALHDQRPGEAVLLGQHLVGRRRAEVIDADGEPVGADPGVPQIGAPGFDAHALALRRQHALAPGHVLPAELLHARHRHH